MASILLESRSYRPFKSSEEYLEAMREDLAEWLNTMYPELMINADNFMDRLDTGVTLCKHANNVRQAAEEYLARRQARNKSMTRSMTSGLAGPILAMGQIHFLHAAKSGTFFARDNVSNFITWCRKGLKIIECLLFETDDLIMRKNEKHVILCLLEVARRGAKFGMLAPMLVQMEKQIDREIAADNKANGIGCGTQTENSSNIADIGTDMFDTDTEDEDDEGPPLMYGPQPQIITNDLKSLDEMVRDLVEKCTCPSQFPMVRVSEGKYRIGDTKVLIFVRILRSHVMVRVGGGWDTLSHYLDKHDPCRCRAQHRSSIAARLIPRSNNQTNGIELHKAQVIFERSPPAAKKFSPNNSGVQNEGGSPVIISKNQQNMLTPPLRARSRSRSPTMKKKSCSFGDNSENLNESNEHQINQQIPGSPRLSRRSVSPSPKKLSDVKRKQISIDLPIINTSYKLVTNIENPTDTIVSGEIEKNEINIEKVTTEITGKYENISDNGSEISDEGYRSLGIVQSNNQNGVVGIIQKRESVHSQTSVDDAELSVRLENTSTDTTTSPSDDQSLNKTLEISETKDEADISMNFSTSSLSPKKDKNDEEENKINNSFENSGVFITDDKITVDIAQSTGLRKTGFSDNLYCDDQQINKRIPCKIPRSPIPIRRRSFDNSDNDLTNRTGLPIFNRKQPVYRSVRRINEQIETPVKDVTNTWGGRTSTKKRPSIQNDTFASPSGNFNRNSKGRTSQVIYDSNGRRVKGSSTSLTTSPVKGNTTNVSPLAQQLLEAAGNAKNDAQILEKMKQLLTKYSSNSNTFNNKMKKTDYDDFTSAWVHYNGNLDRVSNCSVTAKGSSKRSSAASSIESNNSKDISVIVSPRRDRGLSKIPAPVRNNTELY